MPVILLKGQIFIIRFLFITNFSHLSCTHAKEKSSFRSFKSPECIKSKVCADVRKCVLNSWDTDGSISPMRGDPGAVGLRLGCVLTKLSCFSRSLESASFSCMPPFHTTSTFRYGPYAMCFFEPVCCRFKLGCLEFSLLPGILLSPSKIGRGESYSFYLVL